MLSLGEKPHQGTLRPELLPGLRSVTKQRAIFYFIVDEPKRQVRVLAVFFGGQDHQRQMLRRLLSP
jgi:plasmid stabilization system protein ParE